MAISNDRDNKSSRLTQTAKSIFSLNKTTGIVFAVLAFFAEAFFVSFATANGAGAFVFGIILLMILFPFSLLLRFIVLDWASLGIITPLVFLYLYFLSCLISYGLRAIGRKFHSP